eukprot:Rhum_TRINITY_DN14181_c5_g1::Rhum_TRINITY_DN14181_c5_g1_i1::g.72455::m.72455
MRGAGGAALRHTLRQVLRRRHLCRRRTLRRVHPQARVGRRDEACAEVVGLQKGRRGDGEGGVGVLVLVAHGGSVHFGHLDDGDAHGPDVDLVGVRTTGGHLGCHPVRGAHDARCVCPDAGGAEVGQDSFTFCPQQDVFALDVAVHHPVLVQVSQRRNDALQNAANLRLRERAAAEPHRLGHGPPVAELQHQPHFVLHANLHERPVKLHDAGMLQLLQQRELRQHGVGFVRAGVLVYIDATDEQLLQRHVLPRLSVQLHGLEDAASQAAHTGSSEDAFNAALGPVARVLDVWITLLNEVQVAKALFQFYLPHLMGRVVCRRGGGRG